MSCGRLEMLQNRAEVRPIALSSLVAEEDEPVERALLDSNNHVVLRCMTWVNCELRAPPRIELKNPIFLPK